MSNEILQRAIEHAKESYDETPSAGVVNFASLVAWQYHAEMTDWRSISNGIVPEAGEDILLKRVNHRPAVIRWHSSDIDNAINQGWKWKPIEFR